MVTIKLEQLADTLYTVHADLLSMSIIGKDCERYNNVLARIGRIQQDIRAVVEVIRSEKEAPKDVGTNQ